MPLRTSWSGDNCPIARAADVFADPWSLLVLREVFMGNRRFDGIKKALKVADNVLSERLRRLVEADILVAEPYSAGVRPRNEYRLTAAGADALPVLHALTAWAQRNTDSPSGRALRIVCTRCGSESASGTWCQSCGKDLTAETTAWDHPKTPGELIELGAAT
ncbi:transcriptional regulator [Arthrobacter sp. BB-1]|uniref:winged helix-turn-helix transcriptional regulator n=1 Tax=Micrococcaceae TaxID=1268 RepID=UPI00111254ED|nr:MULTISPECIES: helix-turn-helix domain-containing protein [Micrococcaceae]TNB69992.1 transcriptional regulator [Arthrobacter sp. BB-1]UEL28047.1 helix-turn-helix transcriptional regulator [Pseudarthrobacter sp. L1SW]